MPNTTTNDINTKIENNASKITDKQIVSAAHTYAFGIEMIRKTNDDANSIDTIEGEADDGTKITYDTKKIIDTYKNAQSVDDLTTDQQDSLREMIAIGELSDEDAENLTDEQKIYEQPTNLLLDYMMLLSKQKKNLKKE